MVTFRNRRFCRAVYRPVSWSDAQRFRWVTVLHMCMGLAIPTLVIGTDRHSDWFFDAGMKQWLGPLLSVVLGHACCLLWSTAVTGVQSYWFHPRRIDKRQQSRAVALSYYACAPLAWSPLTAVLLFIGVGAYGDMIGWGFSDVDLAAPGAPTMVLPFVLGYALAAAQLLGWWFVSVQMARRVALQRGAGLITVAGVLPVC